MKINRLTVFEIGHNTFRLESLGRVNCYLLYGTERGMLIDCGFGLEPIKPAIDQLCKVPYDVCITHADGDHIGAFYEWERVWLHPADHELAYDLEHVNFQRFTGMHTVLNPMIIQENGDEPDDLYRMSELKPAPLTLDDYPVLLPLEDGQVFDLGGGRKVTVLLVPGHTMGSTVYIDNAARIMFSGDAISAASDIKMITAAEGYQNMKRLLEQYGNQFDRIYPAHTGIGQGAVNMNFSLPKSIIQDYMDICRSIMDGTVEIMPPRKEPNPDFHHEKENDSRNMQNAKNPDEKQSEGVVEIAHSYGAMQHFNFRP